MMKALNLLFVISSCWMLLLLQSVEANELRIIPAGPHHMPVGRNLFFTCKAQVQNPELVRDLKWYAPNGGQIPEDDRVYTEEQPGDAAIMLFIKNLREEDSGKYRCKGVYANSEQMEAEVQISTFIGITWDDAPVDQAAIVNEDYKIRCVVRAAPPATIDWLKESLIISTGDRYVIETDGLLIKNVNIQDAGTYTCRARVLETGSLEERDIKLEVQTPPKWITKPRNVKGIEQERAEFHCEAEGTPSPIYEWVDWEGRSAVDKEGWSIKKDSGMLTAYYLKWEDQGKYTCIAENPAGRIEHTVELDVIVKPRVQELFNKTFPVDRSEGKITCKASGEPVPEIIWRKWSRNEPYIVGGQPDDDRIYVNNYLERAPDYTTSGEIQWAVSELVINGVQRKDDGLYECQARNEGGKFFKSGHIQVEFAPTFEEQPMKDEWSWDQNPVNLTCIATAIPNATITWWFRDREIGRELIDRNLEIIGNGPRSDLKITPLEIQYYGRYTCKAENPYGKAQLEMELHLAREPSVIRQAITDKVTATTIQFRFVSPTDTGGLPIDSYAVEYREIAQEWKDARRRLWPASQDGDYILENLQPVTTYEFRFAAKNLVGLSEWGASQVFTMPRRGPPEPPIFNTEGRPVYNDVVNITSPTRFEVSWKLPEDNGQIIDYFELSFYPVQFDPSTSTWPRIGNLFRTEIPHPGNVRYEIKDLYPDTYHQVELRAHNELGFSDKSVLIVKTAKGEGPVLPPWTGDQAGVSVPALLGILFLVIVVVAVAVDVTCCKINQKGLTAFVVYRVRRSAKDRQRSSSKQRLPPLLRSEKRPVPGIRERQSIIGVPEEDPLLNGSAAPKHPTIVTSTETTASQLNGNNKKANNGGTTSVAPPTNIKVNGVANLSSATKVNGSVTSNGQNGHSQNGQKAAAPQPPVPKKETAINMSGNGSMASSVMANGASSLMNGKISMFTEGLRNII